MAAFTLAHILISVAGIVSGFVVIFGLLRDRPPDGWTGFFLTTTVLTSVTGFMFPFRRLMPAHVFGVISLGFLALTILARYRFRLHGAWRATYVVSAVMAQYFNVFALVVYLFREVPALKAIAPTQTEAPFVIAQLAVLATFVVLATLGVKRFHDKPLVFSSAPTPRFFDRAP